MKLSTQISLGFLIAISIDLMDSWFNYTLTLKVKNDSHFLTRSETALRNSGKLNKSITDMQSSFRGYLLTGDEHFLAPYYDGLHTVPGLLTEEKGIDSTSPQFQKIDSIDHLHALWVGYADSLIVAKKSSVSDPEASRRYQVLFETRLKKEVGRSYNDEIARLFTSFDQYEYQLREARHIALAASIARTERFSVLFSMLMIIVSSGIAIFLVTKISRRIVSLVRLAENISRGNFSRINDDKRDELSSLSLSLDTMSARLSKNITELKKKNDELSQFAYVVSHDLKAPVRGIASVVQWIEEDLHDEISEKMRTYLDIIPDRISRIEALIDGLLEYARVGRENSIKEWVEVAALIDDLVDIVVPEEYQVIKNNLPGFLTEKLLLQQVFGNLISNAVKYGRGEIAVSCVERADYYEFSVSDNGPGIPEEYREKIFVIFQTLREKEDKESTGIGLAIVKKIIDDKHCSIRVRSSGTGGAMFEFTWPKT